MSSSSMRRTHHHLRPRPPNFLNREARRQLAETTLATTIPDLLASDPRADAGVKSTALVTNLSKLPPEHDEAPLPVIFVSPTDTYSTGRALQLQSPGSKVAVLNFASPKNPGGGFLKGASAQEENLCLRSTLFPAITIKKFHPMPVVSCLYTSDICVFRDGDNLRKDLAPEDRYYLDVITSGMVASPKVKDGRYEIPEVRELVRKKIRLVMRLCVDKGVQKVVLGAWGCGAYRNPLQEIVEAFKEVLTDGQEHWEGVEEVVFAILDRGDMAERFKELWGEGIVWKNFVDNGVAESEEGTA